MRSLSRALLALPLCLALTACGGEEETPVTPTLGLEGPSSIRVIPGSAGSLDFVLQRNETATGEVSFDVAGLPEGVSATFEPAVLSGTSVATTLHLQAGRDVTRGGFLVTVQATGPESLLAERQFALDIRGLNIEGRVHSRIHGLPPDPVQIRVGTQITMSAPDGTFNIQDVAIPYDLELDAPEIRQRFLGLTTPTPAVSALLVTPARVDSAKDATIEGTIAPAPIAGERVTVCASGPPEVLLPACRTLEGGATAFVLNLKLLGVESSEVRVVARRTVSQESTVMGFNGFAEQTVTIAAERTSVAALNLTSASSTAVPLALTDHDYDTGSFSTWTQFGGHLVHQPLDPIEPVAHVPENGLTFIAASGEMDDHIANAFVLQAVNGALDAPLELPRPLKLFGPAEGEAVSPGMTLGVEDPGPGINSFLLQHESPYRIVLVHTTGDRVTLADFGEAELAETYTWVAYHDDVTDDLDAMVEQGSSLSRIIALESQVVPQFTEGRAALSFSMGGPLGAGSGAAGLAAPVARPGLLPALER